MTRLDVRASTEVAVRTEDAARLRDLVDSVDGILWEADATTFRFTFVSRRAEAVLGYPVEAWTDVPTFWADHIHPADRGWAVDFCLRETAAKKDHVFEYRMVAADGRVVWLRDVVYVVLGDDGRPRLLRGLMTDITARKRAEQRLAAQHAVASLLAASPSLPRAAPAILRAVGEALDLDSANLWVVDRVAGELRHQASWASATSASAPFLDASRRMRFTPGLGLPGRAWADRRVVWRDELEKDFPRREAAAEAGLVSGVAFPLVYGDTVHAVAEFFSRDAFRAEPELGQTLEVLGSQIGMFVERTRAALAAERERARLDDLVKNIPGVVWESWGSPDADDQRVDFVSEHVEDMLGYSVEEWLSTPNFWLRIVHPDDRERAARESAAIYRSGRSGLVEFRWVRKDGGVLWVVARSKVVTDPEGRPIGMRGVTLDVSVHKLAERALREAERRSAAILEAALDAIVTIDEAGRVVEFNPAAERTFGYARADAVGRPIADLIVPETHRAAHREGIRRFLATKEERVLGRRVEMPAVRKDGSTIPVELAITAFESDGRTMFTAQIRDISDRKASESALQDSEARYRFLADLVPQQVWTALPDGQIDYVNARLVEYFGRAAQDLDGDGWQAHVHPEDLQPCIERWRRSLATGEAYEMEFRLRRADGVYRWHIARAVPLRGDDGAIVRWFGTNTDITEHKETQRVLSQRAKELADLAEALERSNRELDQFAYITSHDLKAPLRGIANLSRWIEEDLEGTISGDAARHFDLLRGRVNRMEALIDAILQYSRVGRVRERPERVDTGQLLAEVVDLLAPPEGFRVEIADGMPTLHTERAPLQQVFLNLVGNAIKHHDRPDGAVRVGVEDGGDHWRFAVGDDGPGIPPRFHDKVFVIFQTLQARDKREGTGIGLALVKKIVESHGGAITLESEGRGATFRFTWPKHPSSGGVPS